MTTDNVIQIKGGRYVKVVVRMISIKSVFRHILQELTVPSFVPNDTFLVGGAGNDASPGPRMDNLRLDRPQRQQLINVDNDFDNGASMVVLTGPNYSGKSVYLKQVAIIVFMAHVGSFVPAESATIGITDKILSRVSTRESVSRNQSTFMLDLQQISLALSLATRRSLVVIDEFGKGTDSSDGAGLAAAVIRHLISLGDERPKVLGATHFHGEVVPAFRCHELTPIRNF